MKTLWKYLKAHWRLIFFVHGRDKDKKKPIVETTGANDCLPYEKNVLSFCAVYSFNQSWSLFVLI